VIEVDEFVRLSFAVDYRRSIWRWPGSLHILSHTHTRGRLGFSILGTTAAAWHQQQPAAPLG